MKNIEKLNLKHLFLGGLFLISLSIFPTNVQADAETTTASSEPVSTIVQETTTLPIEKATIREPIKKIPPCRKVKKLFLNQSKIRLNKGDHRYLKIRVKYRGKRKRKEPIIWRSSNPSVARVNKKGIVTGRKKGTATIKVYSKYTKKIAKCNVTVGPTKYIAITFDDGPGDSTPKLLKALNRYDSKATFFLVGQYAVKKPKLVKKQYRSGMQIGNHTWSHANLNVVSTAEIKSQINKNKSALKGILGTKPSIFRPPYGNYNPTVSKTVDVPMLYWSVDTLDWKNRNVQYVCKTILNNAYDGAIVLLHDSHPTTVNGFIQAQPKLIQRHFELVTVEELFRIKHKKMNNGVMYYNVK
ncbi:MAG: polysaccharide deacetylase family protein [Eubacterium sp.]|nr:polysaccharide deacetylase family protein [Eubacterium sp.]